MTDLSNLLGRLSDAFGPSGREAAVRSLIKAEVEPLVDRLEVDAMGNLITFKAGTGAEPRLKVMLSAHMDEVGFMITEVDKSGLLKFVPWAASMRGSCWRSGCSSVATEPGRRCPASSPAPCRTCRPRRASAACWRSTTWPSTSAPRTRRRPTAR